MLNLVGKTIRIDGKKSKVVGAIAAGKHMRFVLEDGRDFLDLHERNDYEIEKEKTNISGGHKRKKTMDI